MIDIPDDYDWAAYVRTAAPLQGYHLSEEQIGQVAAQLRLIARNAAPLLSAMQDMRLEPASVFRP
jgi:hypothetical protein